jgi:branched-chain amino acid transport system substrate-binding protein
MKRAGFALAILAAALAQASCGSGTGSNDTVGNRIRGDTLTVYASVPLHGASRVSGQAVANAEQLALNQARDRVGRYRIVLKVLDDATVKSDGWDPGQTTANARVAVLDPTTIGYLGDLNSGASAISIPPLNRAGIPQISPTSAAVGLTSSAPGAFPGEPQKYYPTGVRTFARIAPTNQVQGVAQVEVQKDMGCATTYVLDDGEVDGADAARSFEVAAQAGGIKLAGIQPFVRGAKNYIALAKGVKAVDPDCVLISADTESGAALLTEQLARAMPAAKIFCTQGLAESTYTEPGEGGLPLSLDPRVVLTAPTLGLSDYPASARRFTAAYQRIYGPPEPDAIFGYEAMNLLLDAIGRATDHGRIAAERSNVVSAIFATRDRHGAIGTYSIQRDGDSNLKRYGVYGIVAGQLSFWEAVDA